MKKLLLIAGLLTGSVLFANAQVMTKKSADERAAHQTKALTKKLSLTTDQSNKVNSILLAQATKMDSLTANTSGDKKAIRMSRKTILQTTEQQMTNVLTPDQQQAYLKFKEMHKHKEKKNAGTDTPEMQG